MTSLQILFIFTTVVMGFPTHALSEETEALACLDKVEKWHAKSHHPGDSQLVEVSKPRRPESPEPAILLMPGEDPTCEICSGLKGAAILVLSSGTYLISYGDAERASMKPGAEYLDAKIVGAQNQDLLVSFMDSKLIAAARTPTDSKGARLGVFWPQSVRDWKRIVATDPDVKYVPVQVQSITGTSAALSALNRIERLLESDVNATFEHLRSDPDGADNLSVNALKRRVSDLRKLVTFKSLPQQSEGGENLSEVQKVGSVPGDSVVLMKSELDQTQIRREEAIAQLNALSQKLADRSLAINEIMADFKASRTASCP